MDKKTVYWFRRDLRFKDNTALIEALHSGSNVLPIFIFDDNIVSELSDDDPRVSFIYLTLQKLNEELNNNSSSILCLKGNPLDIWQGLIQEYSIESVYINKDYEPYAISRDSEIKSLLEASGIKLKSFKDQVIFEEREVVKNDGSPYTVYTPYKNKWLSLYQNSTTAREPVNFANFHKEIFNFPSLNDLGFKETEIRIRDFSLENIDEYGSQRDFPSRDKGSYLGPHLRFGTISIRQVVSKVLGNSEIFVNELIWREFFMQIIYNYPLVVDSNFRSKYDGIVWRNNEDEFERWCAGQTGYPMVDAGMRELNSTGYMHNRVRMITAGFLCKHLLIDWKWGETYFASKLLDYELSSNNGNWQWAAGTGCDAAPYFRVFNPIEQQRKFDPDSIYIKKWIPEYGTDLYPLPIVEHKFARSRALNTYKAGIKK